MWQVLFFVPRVKIGPANSQVAPTPGSVIRCEGAERGGEKALRRAGEKSERKGTSVQMGGSSQDVRSKTQLLIIHVCAHGGSSHLSPQGVRSGVNTELEPQMVFHYSESNGGQGEGDPCFVFGCRGKWHS